MRCIVSLVVLMAAAFASAERRTTPVYIQPVGSPIVPPAFLAEIEYDIADGFSSVSSFDAPELPDGAKLARIGVYDPATSQWLSSTTVTSVDSFGKGYSPHFLLSVDAQGRHLGVSCRGVRIDAGQTRDFGPQSRVAVTELGKQVELNKPVVLSPEGKKVEEQEKTFFQKYICSSFSWVASAHGSTNSSSQVLVGVGRRSLAPDVRRWGRAEVIERVIAGNEGFTWRRSRASLFSESRVHMVIPPWLKA
jgi:hypothetical protein